ncbi:hypothetical protein JZ751_013572 [Albula glossodonta]|uniref:AB hydrolase-1 domain-containing protein n=1 Tax=Albula glossodonta TaxID=121402 RepID=A0A8T2MJT4_9TELE|nr:hypothetical protein JZ751_013572 [Albula glossodonta]
MLRYLCTRALVTSSVRLSLKMKSVLYWSLIYCLCGIFASFAVLELCWNLIIRPTKTLHWRIRESPPACLNDPSLGTHCYVRVKLREFRSEYRVVAMDMRGYGESDAPKSISSYRWDLLMQDVKDMVESLGYNRCLLVAHDWGGLLAWLFSIHYPEMVTKLIVLNCPHPSAFTARPQPQAAAPALRKVFTSRRTGVRSKSGQMTKEDLEAYLYNFSQPGALIGPINYYRNIFSSLTLRETEVKSPVLLLWGEKDAFLGQEMAEMSRPYAKAGFRLHLISGASHWLQQDQPDIVNTLIWTFLKEGEGSRSYRT